MGLFLGSDKISPVEIIKQGEIKNQNISVTKNGTYTYANGYTGLGTVDVNVSGGSGVYEAQLTLQNIIESGEQQTIQSVTNQVNPILEDILGE